MTSQSNKNPKLVSNGNIQEHIQVTQVYACLQIQGTCLCLWDPFFSAYGSQKPESPASFELKVKSGIIMFWTMFATDYNKGGIQVAPNSSGRRGVRCPFTHITPEPASAAKVSTNDVETCNLQGLRPQWGQVQSWLTHTGKSTRRDSDWAPTSRHHHQTVLLLRCSCRCCLQTSGRAQLSQCEDDEQAQSGTVGYVP